MAADLDAGIHAGLDEKLQLKNEISVHLFGAEEAVGRIENRGPDDHSVFDGVFRLSVALDPAVKGLAVKEVLPLLSLGNRYLREQNTYYAKRQ